MRFVSDAFHFSVGLPSLALLIIPLSYIVLTRNKKLPDVLHIIIPHIVSLFNSLFVYQNFNNF